MVKDYYEILGVKKIDSADVIKKSYKKLAMKYHPDKAENDEKKKEYEDKFKEINQAYSTLSDEGKKRQYDMGGGTSSQFRQRGGGHSGGFGDMFGDIFGGGGFGEDAPDLDLHYRLVIDFMEAVFGVEKEIAMKKDVPCKKCDGSGSKDGKFDTCKKCGGQGRIEMIQQTPFGAMRRVVNCDACDGGGKIAKNKCSKCGGDGIASSREKVKIKIPVGIDNGQTIRVSGGGNASKNSRTGDLFLQIQVKPHNVFKRDGDDIYMDFSITFAQAALGDEVKIPTLDDKIKIKIGKGTESGSVLRLRDEGVANVNSPLYKGDLFVNIIVETPKKLSKAQVKLFKELRKLD